MGTLISDKDKPRYLDRVKAYYDHVWSLRNDGDLEGLKSVEGKPFLYRPDGVDIYDAEGHFAIWNMRFAPPPQTFDLNGNKYTLSGKLAPESVPIEFPDLDDSAIVDVSAEDFLDRVLEDAAVAWREPFAQRRYKSANDMLERALDNMCQGDIIFDVVPVTPELRAAKGWDKHDWPGNPWVQIGAQSYLAKTQRQRHIARIAARRHDINAEQYPVCEGDPMGPNVTDREEVLHV